MNRTSAFCCLALLLYSSWVKSAAEYRFSFEQVLAIAFSQNLNLLTETEREQLQLASEGVAFRRLLPSLSVSANQTNILKDSQQHSNEGSRYASSMDISQPLYQPTLMAGWKKSQLNLQRAQLSTRRQRQQLLSDVKGAWFNLQQALELQSEAQESLIRLQQHRNNAEAFYNSGRIWRNDVLQAEVKVARGEQDLIAANNNVIKGQSRLNLLLHRHVSAPMAVVVGMKWQPLQQNLREAFQYALSHRLELKQSQIDIELAQYDEAIARAGLKPTIDIKLSQTFKSSHYDFRASQSETKVAVNMKWEVWQWGRSNKEISAARSKLKINRYAEQQEKEQVLADVQNAWLSVTEAQKNIDVLKQALDQAKENFRVSEIRYKEQLGSATDVLDAQELLTQTRADNIVALGSYLTAIASLKLAVGEGVRLNGEYERE